MYDHVYVLSTREIKRFDIIQKLIVHCDGRRVTKPYYKRQTNVLKKCNYGPVTMWNVKSLDILSEKDKEIISRHMSEVEGRILLVWCRSNKQSSSLF